MEKEGGRGIIREEGKQKSKAQQVDCVTVGNQKLGDEQSLQITEERNSMMEWLKP